MYNFDDVAEAVQHELSTIINDKRFSGSFRIRERQRVLRRWMVHCYNMGRGEVLKEIAEKGNPLDDFKNVVINLPKMDVITDPLLNVEVIQLPLELDPTPTMGPEPIKAPIIPLKEPIEEP